MAVKCIERNWVMSLLTLGAGQLLCYLFLVSLGDLRRNITACEIGFFAAFLLYGMALFFLRKNQYAMPKSKSPLLIILFFALCFRLCMWVSVPSLSDDIYRYLWEGKLVAAGINPFVHAPSDPSLAQLHDSAVFPHINHKEYPAIYPPLNQFIFALSTIVRPTINAMNMTFILFDLLTMALLFLILRERQLDPARIIIYAWNPLVIMEFAGSGHLDSAGIFFLMLAFYFFTKKRSWSSALALALSFLIKFIPLIFLPFLVVRRKMITLSVFVFTAILLYFPFLDAGRKLFESLLVYTEHWVFNASLYDVILWMGVSPLHARGISVLLLLLLVTVLFFRYAQKKSDEQEDSIYHVGFVALGSFLLLTPTIHPWYLCWMVPFLVIFPNRAWIYFTGSVFLSYFILKGYAEAGVWKENTAVKLAEYLPFYTLLICDAARRYRSKPSPGILSRTAGQTELIFTPPLHEKHMNSNRKRVSVIIPALNEKDSIGLVIGDIPKHLVDEIIVVDNGSTDGTAEVALNSGVRVVSENHRGYGAACLRGIEAARNPDIIVFMDGDYSDYPEEMEHILAPIRKDKADLVIGSRIAGAASEPVLPPHSYWGNRLTTWLINALYHHRFTDLGPFRAITYDGLKKLAMRDTNYGWTVEMQVKAVTNGLKVVEIPVSYRKRIGKSKVTGTIAGSLKAGIKMLYTVFSLRSPKEVKSASGNRR